MGYGPVRVRYGVRMAGLVGGVQMRWFARERAPDMF
mgnify:CR=1 FL=1